MRKPFVPASLFLTALLLKAVCAAAEPDRAVPVLELRSIGFPAWDHQPAAWNINVLKVFNERLYLGYGDATINTGPTDVIYYDLRSEKFTKEFKVDDEGIYQYQVIDGSLTIPGVDATEEWDFGNIYVLGDSGWVKHRSITRGLHVFDAVSYKGRWFVGTGNYCEFTKDEGFAFGAILSSADSCKTWKYEYMTPCDKNGVYRISALTAFQGRLYAFPYAYVGYSLEEVPTEYRQYLGEPYVDGGKEYYLVSMDGAFGNNDAISFDGSLWRPVDIVPDPQAYRTRPAVYRDKLILSVISGKYINSVSGHVEQKGRLPGNVNTSLYVFNGEKTEKLDLEYELIQDIQPKQDKLYILYFAEGRHRIAETTDLKAWKHYLLPSFLKKPLSLEVDSSELYVGVADGNIFRADLNAAAADEGADRSPAKFYGAAETAKEAQRYWAAVTGWTILGRAAKYSCEVKTDNAIDINTENLSGLIVFLPPGHLDMTQPMTLVVDGQEVYKGRPTGFKSIDLAQKGGKWQCTKSDRTLETFKPDEMVVGRAASNLSRKGEEAETANWQADVLKWAGKSDIAMTTRGSVKKDIPRGNITVSDVFDQNYRNTICIFRATGADIRRMLEHNLRHCRGGERVQVSGLEFGYGSFRDPLQNTIIGLSLAPEKEYKVAATSYLAQEAKTMLGQGVKAEDTGLGVVEATIGWLREHGKIGAISPRIKAKKID